MNQRHFIMLKVLFHNKDITVMDIYALNNTVNTYKTEVQEMQGNAQKYKLIQKILIYYSSYKKDQVGEKVSILRYKQHNQSGRYFGYILNSLP